MNSQNGGQELQERLEGFGDPRDTCGWTRGEPDYVAALGVTQADVPQLIAQARQWTEREDWPEDQDDMTVYAPIHAWRAVAQLGAADAVDPLLSMIEPMDRRDDDWYLEEFPFAFAWIGPVSIEPLRAYLADDGRLEFARICVAHSLAEVALRHPDCRDEVIGILGSQLEHFEKQPETVNAFLVGHLLDLKATEAAGVIERAYAADRVDLSVLGNWNMVRTELGVEGQGLVPESLANARAAPLVSLPQPQRLKPSPTASQRSKTTAERRVQRKRDRRNRRRGRKR